MKKEEARAFIAALHAVFEEDSRPVKLTLMGPTTVIKIKTKGLDEVVVVIKKRE